MRTWQGHPGLPVQALLNQVSLAPQSHSLRSGCSQACLKAASCPTLPPGHWRMPQKHFSQEGPWFPLEEEGWKDYEDADRTQAPPLLYVGHFFVHPAQAFPA